MSSIYHRYSSISLTRDVQSLITEHRQRTLHITHPVTPPPDSSYAPASHTRDADGFSTGETPSVILVSSPSSRSGLNEDGPNSTSSYQNPSTTEEDANSDAGPDTNHTNSEDEDAILDVESGLDETSDYVYESSDSSREASDDDDMEVETETEEEDNQSRDEMYEDDHNDDIPEHDPDEDNLPEEYRSSPESNEGEQSAHKQDQELSNDAPAERHHFIAQNLHYALSPPRDIQTKDPMQPRPHTLPEDVHSPGMSEGENGAECSQIVLTTTIRVRVKSEKSRWTWIPTILKGMTGSTGSFMNRFKNLKHQWEMRLDLLLGGNPCTVTHHHHQALQVLQPPLHHRIQVSREANMRVHLLP